MRSPKHSSITSLPGLKSFNRFQLSQLSSQNRVHISYTVVFTLYPGELYWTLAPATMKRPQTLLCTWENPSSLLPSSPLSFIASLLLSRPSTLTQSMYPYLYQSPNHLSYSECSYPKILAIFSSFLLPLLKFQIPFEHRLWNSVIRKINSFLNGLSPLLL